MRIRDIQQTGFYGRPAATNADGRPPGSRKHDLTLHALHVIGIAPMFILQLVRFVFIPMMESPNGGCELIDSAALFDDNDEWRFLCDGSEPDFGPHTVLMKLLQAGGYGEDDARRIARDALVEALDRQIREAAQTPGRTRPENT